MPDRTADLLRDHYDVAAKDLVRPLVNFLVVGRRVFGGDLDKMAIWVLVALRTVESPEIRGMAWNNIVGGRFDSYPSLHTNVRSIAESTGIARETVRRKVGEMIEAGWIERRGDDLAITPAGSQHIGELRDAVVEMAARNHALVERLRKKGAP